MSQSPAPSRRRYRRVSVDVPIRISTIDPEPDPSTGRPCFRSSRDHCRNVSRGGLYVHAEDPLSPGRRVLMELELPGGRGFEAVGRVAWCRAVHAEARAATEIGIEFLGGSLDQLVRLEEFLSSSSPQGT